MTITKTWWFLPLFSLVLGAACFAAFAIGGETRGGVQAFAVMAALAVLFALGGRSETIRCAATAGTSASRGSTSSRPPSRATCSSAS